MLDIGCGVGHGLEPLARSGITAIGIEPSVHSRALRANVQTAIAPTSPSFGFDDDARWLANVRNPEVGFDLPELVERAGADIADIVDEHSVWPSLTRAQVGINLEAALARCVDRGSMRAADAAEWLADQRRRDREGAFRATITKRLVVGRVR